MRIAAALLVTLLLAMRALAQDGSAQLAVALNDLAARLGKAVAVSDLSSWSFSIQLYQNTNLGCDIAPGDAAPEGIQTFVFNIVHEGITYDYRVSANGAIVFPCGGAFAAATAPAQANVEVAVCPPDYTGFLTSRLTINMNAQVVAGNDPNRVREAPSTSAPQIGVIQPGRVFAIIGGPSCAENIVWWQVAADTLVGWTAEGVLPDDYFIEPVGAAVAPTLPPAPTSAPPQTVASAPALQAAAPQLAAVTDAGLTIYVPGSAPVVVPGTAGADSMTPLVWDMAWSPDGQTLAYTTFEGQAGARLFTVSLANPTTPTEVVTGGRLVTSLPPAFTLDGRLMYGIQGPDVPPSETSPSGFNVEVFMLDLAPGSSPQVYGMFVFGVGCGGGSSFPGDWLRGSETGMGTSLGPQVMQATPWGLLHTVNCVGRGIALLDPAADTDTPLGDFARAVVSPDGSKVAVVSIDMSTIELSTRLSVIDLTTRQQTILGTADQPDQLAWGHSGELYYSTRKPGRTLDLSPEALQNLTNMGFPTPITLRNISIHRVDVTAQTDTEIFAAEAYAVGRMFSTPDNLLYFSVIPNGEQWFQGTAGGDPMAAFPMALLSIPGGGGQSQVVGVGVRKATPFIAEFRG